MSQTITSSFVLPTCSLWWREVVRFLRQKHRVVGALGPPIVFWLLIGSGFGGSFQPSSGPEGVSYLEYFFPGTVILILLFTAVFSTITIIEDRREGFLQSVLVAPISRMSLVLGKILGGTTLALAQGLVFVLLAPFAGISIGLLQAMEMVAVLFVIAFSLTGFGFILAWRMDSTQGFHAIMNLFLMPMWLLSEAVFPASGAPGWLQWMIRANPLTYCVASLRHILYPAGSEAAAALPSLVLSIGVMLVFAVATIWIAVAMAGRES